MNPKNNPKVSVCVATRNHTDFIEQCVRSALDQKTTFDFEVIVGDDASTDSTPEILRNLQIEYPDNLTVIVHKSHINGSQNYFSVHNRAMGQYVAHIDGDDYWLPGKLQRMVDVMDENHDVNIAWHRVFVEVEDGARVVAMPIGNHHKLFGGYKLDFNTLIKYYGTTGQHSASIYRRSARKMFSSDVEMLDYFHTLSLCEDGYALYVPDVLSIYRAYRSYTTITNTPGAPAVANALIYLLDHYRERFPKYRKEICAQAVFNGALRGWLGFKQWIEFYKLAARTKTLPRLRDLFFIFRIFMAQRGSVRARLLKKYRNDLKKIVGAL